MKKRKEKTFGATIIEGLEDAVAFQKGQRQLRTTTRTLIPPAPSYTKQHIKSIRQELLKMTQPEFAHALNVSPSTVKSWEQGIRKPDNASNRLLQLIEQHPDWLQEIAQ